MSRCERFSVAPVDYDREAGLRYVAEFLGELKQGAGRFAKRCPASASQGVRRQETDVRGRFKSNRTRSRVERPFGVVKHLRGCRKTRYRGLRKNAAQVYTLFALANFYMARKELTAVAG